MYLKKSLLHIYGVRPIYIIIVDVNANTFWKLFNTIGFIFHINKYVLFVMGKL